MRKLMISGRGRRAVSLTAGGLGQPSHGGNTGSNPVCATSQITRGGNKAGNKKRVFRLVLAFVAMVVMGGSAEGVGWGGERLRAACSGEFHHGVVMHSDALCPGGGWCWKEEMWIYDECGHLVSYSCESGSDCPEDCELSCEEPEPAPHPRPDFEPMRSDPEVLPDHREGVHPVLACEVAAVTVAVEPPRDDSRRAERQLGHRPAPPAGVAVGPLQREP
jgi:hypothetical protein